MKIKTYSKNNTERILHFLKTHHDFQFSALQIQEALQSDAIQPNLTTIYRQLEKMVQASKVLQFYSEDGNTKLFQINRRDCDSHLHIKCAVCGKILHLDCSEVDTFLAHLKETHQIKVNCETSLLFGICSDCENLR